MISIGRQGGGGRGEGGGGEGGGGRGEGGGGDYNLSMTSTHKRAHVGYIAAVGRAGRSGCLWLCVLVRRSGFSREA